MKKLLQIFMILSMGLFLNSCYYDSFPEEIPIDPEVEVSYKTDIMPMWDQCVNCHKGQIPPDFRDEYSYDSLLNGYVVAGDADASILYKSLLNLDGVSLMPPSGQWPTSKTDLVKVWIEQGAKNN